MTFADRLRDVTDSTGSIVCMGMDPRKEKILSVTGPRPPGRAELDFYFDILDRAQSEDVYLGAVKPNRGWWAKYENSHGLEQIIRWSKRLEIPVIFDGKYGDIGSSSEAYAKEPFDNFGADSVTLHPYMGTDSVMPFIEKAEEREGGVYVLTRTSNPSAKEFQNLKTEDGTPFYIHVARKVAEWNDDHPGTVGSVVGATSLGELEDIASFFADAGDVPLLIPGVGSQGGSGGEVVDILKEVNYDLGLVRINSSSGINYAYEEEGTDDFAGAAVREIERLNEEIGVI